MLGKEFTVGGIFVDGGLSVIPKDSNQQPLVVTKSFRKGQKWKSPNCLENNLQVIRPAWELVSIEGDDKKKSLMFNKRIQPEQKKEYENPQEFKRIMTELDISQEAIIDMIRDMFLNVFKVSILKKLLAADKIEFIIDEQWMYLKHENKAYRV